MSSTEDDEHGFGLVMPFVVTGEDGYDSEAFVAGVYFGELNVLAKMLTFGASIERYVPTRLVPQIDLLAMKEGVAFSAEAWEEDPDQYWSLVKLGSAARSDEAEN